jgi:hypothetical protein
MPDPKFVKPWHGIPREEIPWHPTVDEDVCIRCERPRITVRDSIAALGARGLPADRTFADSHRV